MDRRGIITAAIRTAFGVGSGVLSSTPDLAKSIISGVATPKVDPFMIGGDPYDRENEEDHMAEGILSELFQAREVARNGRQIDHDIRALKSCSRVYKAALQSERERQAGIERMVRRFKGSPEKLMRTLAKRLTSLS